jgi:hypothetical protein
MAYVIRIIGLRTKHGRATEHDGRLVKYYDSFQLLIDDRYVLETTDRHEDALTAQSSLNRV